MLRSDWSSLVQSTVLPSVIGLFNRPLQPYGMLYQQWTGTFLVLTLLRSPLRPIILSVHLISDTYFIIITIITFKILNFYII